MKKALSYFRQNHILDLLSDPQYLFFSISVFLSQVAYNMLNIILIFLIFFLTSSNFAVAMLLFAVLVPQIALSFIGGVVADVYDKKKILVFGNILRAVVLLLLFFGYRQPVLVYFVTLLVSTITQFYVPAEAPFIPKLVKRDHLVAANSIFGISLFGSILIGYVLAGPVVSIFGRANVFLIISGVFLLAGIFAGMIRQQSSAKKAVVSATSIRKSIRVELKDSFSLLAKTRKVIDAFMLLILSQVIIFMLATLIPGYAKSILQIPAENISLILFAPAAVGMIIAAVGIGSVFNKAPKGKLMTIGIFMSGIALSLLPFTSRILSRGIIISMNSFLPSFLNLNVFNFVIILAFVAGFANALIFIPSQAVIQEIIPEDFRSKIYGLLFALIGVSSLLPIIIAGGVADIFGVGTVLFVLGALIVLLGILRQKFINFIPRSYES